MNEGWFPDPTGKPQERYWDGSEWTAKVRDYPPPASGTRQETQTAGASQSSRPISKNQATPRSPWIVMVVVLLAAGVVVGGIAMWRTNVDNAAREAARAGAALGGSNLSPGLDSSAWIPSRVQVTYEVTAVGYQEDEWEKDASITYETPTGTEQTDVDDGWSRTFTFEPGDFVYLSVQNMTEGYVSCRIEVDGVSISSNTARGEFKIASCDGSV